MQVSVACDAAHPAHVQRRYAVDEQHDDDDSSSKTQNACSDCHDDKDNNKDDATRACVACAHRTHACVVSNADVACVTVALRRLRDKLRASQPAYEDEDVAIISYPADASSGSSPARVCDALDATAADDAAATTAAADDALPSSLACSHVVADNGSSSSRAAAFAAPPSAPRLLTAVNLFDAKQLLLSRGGGSRRSVADVLDMLTQAYALVWRMRDAAHETTTTTSTTTTTAAAATTMRHVSSTARRLVFAASRSRSPTPPPSPSASLASPHAAVATSAAAATTTMTPTMTMQATWSSLVCSLDACVQSLLVYTNVSTLLRATIVNDAQMLHMLCRIGVAARALEAAAAATMTTTAAATTSSRECARDLDAELQTLTTLWARAGLPPRLITALTLCYLADFLLDVALPPAVCSSRYDGLLGVVSGKKQKLACELATLSTRQQGARLTATAATTVSSSSSSLATMASLLQTLPMRGVAALMSLAVHAEPRLRARLLDRLANDDTLLTRLARDMAEAVRVLVADTTTTTTMSSSYNGCNDDTSSIGRLLPVTPSSRAVRRLSYCMDVLLQLSSPDLCCATAGATTMTMTGETDGADDVTSCASSSSSSSSTAAAVTANNATAAAACVRASAWSTHMTALQHLTRQLLRVLCMPSYASLSTMSAAAVTMQSALRAHALQCLCQMVTHTRGLRDMIVAAVAHALLHDNNNKDDNKDSALACEVHDDDDDDGVAHDVSAMLPLLACLLAMHTRDTPACAAHARWCRCFAALTRHLVSAVDADAYELPCVTTRRRSTREWGVTHTRHDDNNDNDNDDAVLVFARELRRDEVLRVSPYMAFARRVVAEAALTYSDEVVDFLAHAVAFAQHIVAMYDGSADAQQLRWRRRRAGSSLYYGQAAACLCVVAPALAQLRASRVGDLHSVDVVTRNAEGDNDNDDDMPATTTTTTTQDVCAATSTRKRAHEHDDDNEDDDEERWGRDTPHVVNDGKCGDDSALQTFIASPQACGDVERALHSNDNDDDDEQHRDDDTATTTRDTSPADESPQDVTRSWRRSLRVLLSPCGSLGSPRSAFRNSNSNNNVDHDDSCTTHERTVE